MTNMILMHDFQSLCQTKYDPIAFIVSFHCFLMDAKTTVNT